MSAIPIHGPEERWRRTVDQRGRPLKLKVGRLLKEFGYARLEPGVGEAIESRLAQVGLLVRPPLRDVTADQVILLELSGPGAQAPAPPDVPEAPAPPAQQFTAPPTPPLSAPPAQQFSTAPAQPFSAQPFAAPAREQTFERTFERPPDRAPAATFAPPPPAARLDPGDEMEQSLLVRAAVEAERRVRNAYDRAAAAAAERIGGLERELAAEREATARARDERDELERRMHVERREAAARLQALSAAERTARGLLEAQRTELSNLTQTVRVTTAAIAQTRETLGNVHEQVRETAADVRDALVENALPEEDAPPPPQLQRFEDLPSAPPLIQPVQAPTAFAPQDPRDLGAEAFDHARPALPVPAYDHDDGDVGDVGDVGETTVFETAREPEPAAQQSLDEIGDGGPLAREQRPEPRQQREPEAKGARKGRGRAERLRRRAAIVCAVCGRPGKTRDPAELVDAGWRVEGEVALCLTCVADDWKLAEGDTVPFRSHG